VEFVQDQMKKQAQQLQQQNLIQAAPLIAGAAKDMAGAQAGQPPAQQPVSLPQPGGR